MIIFCLSFPFEKNSNNPVKMKKTDHCLKKMLKYKRYLFSLSELKLLTNRPYLNILDTSLWLSGGCNLEKQNNRDSGKGGSTLAS